MKKRIGHLTYLLQREEQIKLKLHHTCEHSSDNLPVGVGVVVGSVVIAKVVGGTGVK